MNLVRVVSDEFRQIIGRWIWVGHDRMNARIYWCTKRRAVVGVKYGRM